MQNSAEASASVREQSLIDAFQRAWREQGRTPGIREFLASSNGDPAARKQFLIKLVILDLAHRWQRAGEADAGATTAWASSVAAAEPTVDGLPAQPLLEDYVRAFPELGPLSQLPLEAVVQEYRVRWRWRDGVDDTIYAERFPAYAGQLPAILASVRGDDDPTAPPSASSRNVSVARLARREENERSSLLGDRFRVLRPHARGGLGKVSIARDEELQRDVALKQMHDEHADNPDLQTRFVIEAEVTGRLEHPGVVPVYGLGKSAGGRPYYAMRFIRGESLKEAIAQFHAGEERQAPAGERAVALRKLLRRFLDVCNAIDYAHSRGVLHRDLKPGNIMLGPYGETLVVDWGLAKTVEHKQPDIEVSLIRPSSAGDSTPTLMGSAVGTPAYMSPEQAAGRLYQLGPASDVYGLGATLYALLTGRAPFEGRDTAEVLRKVGQGEFQRPREVNPSIARPLEAICLKAMAVKPEDRYTSAKALADDLERWLADEPVAAYREPVFSRAARWGRKHRTLIAGGFGLVTAAAIGLAISTAVVHQQQHQTEVQRQKAEAEKQHAQSAEARAEQALVKAETEKQHAQAAEATAKEAEARAEQSFYFNTVALAQGHLEQGEIDGGIKLLDSCPPRLRNWEWSFLRDAAARDRRSYGGAPREQATFLAYSADGRGIAVGTRFGRLFLVNDASGKRAGIKTAHNSPIRGIAFRPGGQALATSGSESVAYLWKLPLDGSPAAKPIPLVGHSKSLTRGIAFNHNGRLIATASEDGTVRVWNPDTGKPWRVLRCGGTPVDLAWQGNGPGLLVLLSNSGVCSFDVSSPEKPPALVAPGFSKGRFNRMCASADGKVVAVANNVMLRVFKIDKDGPALIFDQMVQNGAWGLALDRQGKTVATQGPTGIQIFDTESRQLLHHFKADPDNPLAIAPDAIAMAPDGSRVVVKDIVRFQFLPARVRWQSRASELAGGFADTSAPAMPVDDLRVVSPDGTLAAVRDRSRIRILDARSGAELRVLDGAGEGPLKVVFSPRGDFLAAAGTAGRVPVWNVRDGTSIGDFGENILRHTGQFSFSVAAFDATGGTLATSCGFVDPRIRLWSVPDHTCLRTIEDNPYCVTALAFNPDGTRLVSADNDGALRLWDPASGREVLKIDAKQPAVAIQFVAGGAAIQSLARNGTRRFWGGCSAPVPPGKTVSLLPWLRRYDAGSAEDGATKPVAIECPASPMNVFPVPAATAGSYRLVARLARTRSAIRKTVGLLLPAGLGRAMLSLDHEATGKSGLGLVDHQALLKNQTAHPTKLVNSREHLIEVDVRLHNDDAEIVAKLDGEQVVGWHGPQRSLSVFPNWEAPDPRTIALTLGNVDVTVRQLDFTPLDDGARILEPLPEESPPPAVAATAAK